MRIVRTRFVPPGFSAITLGERILVRPGVRLTKYLLAHEIMHVHQWRRHAPFFLILYVWAWIKAGFSYTNNPFEVEARNPTPIATQEAEYLLRETHVHTR